MARKTTTTTDRTRKAPAAATATGSVKTTTAQPVVNQQAAVKADVATSPTPFPTVTEAQIAFRAYELYLARGGAHGNAEADWLQAERELTHARS